MRTRHEEPRARLVATVMRDLLTGESFESVADLVDALKYRLARSRIRWTPDDLTGALRLVGSNHPLLARKDGTLR